MAHVSRLRYQEGLMAEPEQPGEVIYAENKLRLLHYLNDNDTASQSVASPEHNIACEVPLLIVPSLFYRYSILDLARRDSLVGYLVKSGMDVYVLDWGTPGREDRYITFDQYISGSLRRVVQRVRRHSKQKRINLLGYSLGGTMTAIFTALYGDYVLNLV